MVFREGWGGGGGGGRALCNLGVSYVGEVGIDSEVGLGCLKLKFEIE